MQSLRHGDTGSHASAAWCCFWRNPKGMAGLATGNSNAQNKAYRQIDAKAAVAEAEKEKRDALKKTARLRELRLTKEAEDRAADALKPKKAAKTPRKRGLPEFERER